MLVTRLRDSVATVDTQVCARDVLAGVREEKGDGTHEIDGLTHLTLRDQGCPLLLQIRVVVKDLLGPVTF